MPSRPNWHIGRDMEMYPYLASPPERQVAYIFDTNKCIECQTCTIACKTCWTSGKGEETIFWNNVETKPYGGYPQQWDLKLVERTPRAEWVAGTLASPTIFETEGANRPPNGHLPVVDDYRAPNLGEDDITGSVEQGHFFGGVHPMWMFYLARICNHCDHPACLAACPRQAIYKRPEDGIVLVDQSRCRGYQECVQACPYKKVFFNLVSRISQKCIGCYPRVEQGDVALCVESCIGKIRLHGFLSTRTEPRPDNPIDYIVKIRSLALPLYPQHGTGPNVYYIPPVHVPDPFHEQLFGHPGRQCRLGSLFDGGLYTAVRRAMLAAEPGGDLLPGHRGHRGKGECCRAPEWRGPARAGCGSDAGRGRLSIQREPSAEHGCAGSLVPACLPRA